MRSCLEKSSSEVGASFFVVERTSLGLGAVAVCIFSGSLHADDGKVVVVTSWQQCNEARFGLFEDDRVQYTR